MKVNVDRDNRAFAPVTVTFTLETLEELKEVVEDLVGNTTHLYKVWAELQDIYNREDIAQKRPEALSTYGALPYEEEKGTCLTPCSYYEMKKVHSHACGMCNYYRGHDPKRKVVFCEKAKVGKC